VASIPEAIFLSRETDADIALLEESLSSFPVFSEADTVCAVGVQEVSHIPRVSYEELVNKIFAADHVIVI
jgi:hypothetical protein